MITSRHSAVMLAGALALAAAQAAMAGPAVTGLVAEADSAGAVFAAPAAMSRLPGTSMTVEGVVVSSLSQFEVDEELTAVDGGDPRSGDDPVIIPSFYYVRQLDERWHAGVSLAIPTGFGSDYGEEWAGRYNTVEFSLVYVSLTPTVSYRVNERLSLGAGLGINYTAQTSELKVHQPLEAGDGELTADLDGVGISGTLSAFYEFSDRTRAGISWTSDSDADMEGDIKLHDLGPLTDAAFSDLGLKNIDAKITNTLPQRVVTGVYHEFPSGNFMTVDALWMKFSDFSVTDIQLNDNDVNVATPDIYDDFWAVTAGFGIPVDARLTYRVGALYVAQPVDDEDRNFSIRIDEMWGVGAGVSYQFTDRKSVDVNLNVVNLGEAPVDTGEDDRFRVVGESDDPWVVALDIAYNL